MRVERENNNTNLHQTLFHIQNMNITSDGTPYDMFLWSDHQPSKQELEDAFIEDYGCEVDDPLVEEWNSSSNVYPVYAEEIC